MFWFRSYRCRALLCAFLAGFFGLRGDAARAADPVTMLVGSPLARTAKPLAIQVKTGRWFPVAVTLANTGEAVQGRLELRLLASGGQNDREAVFYTEVELPANQARKRVWLYGRSDGEEFDNARVTFSGRGFKSLSVLFNLTPTELGTRNLLTVSDNEERLDYLSSFNNRKLANAEELRIAASTQTLSSGQGFVRPLGTMRDMLPDRWIGLEAVDMVVLQDFPHAALGPEQISALRGYVAAGGTLLVPGGANWQRLAQSPLTDMWPLTPTSSVAISNAQVQQIVGRYLPSSGALSGADRLGGAPVLVTRGALRPDARVLGAMAGEPLLLARDMGAGRVLFLTADPTKPPFLGWRGLAPLWIDLFAHMGKVRRLEYVDRAAMPFSGANVYQYGNSAYNATPINATGQMLQSIRRLAQLRTPDTSVIAWFLALYVFCLVPVNYFVLRSLDRRELAWVTVPIIAVVFSVASYIAARNIKGTELLTRHINIVQSAGASGVARADSMLWFFSPRRASYNISSDNPQMVAGDYIDPFDLSRSEVERTSLSVRQPDAGRAFRVEDIGVNMWSEDKLIGQGVVNLGRGVTVQPTQNGFSVRNDSPFNLRGAVLVTGGQVRGYGDIKSGVSATNGKSDGSDISNPQLVGRIENAAQLREIFKESAASTGATATDTSTMSDLANRALVTALGADFPNNTKQALLIGWSTQAASPLEIENATARAQNVTVFVYRLNPALVARNPKLR
ncbi:MAG TPA: hypothetical protein VF600_00190 [Abditibacteriaceae bacterium]